MARWDVNIDGVNHVIEQKRAMNGAKLIVDGMEQKLKTQNWAIVMIDHPFQIGSKVLRLVVIGNKVDLAIDGVYLGTGQPYVPLSKTPIWAWVLTVISMVVGFFISGLIGLLIGIIGTMVIIPTSINPTRTNPQKVTTCAVTFVICTIIQIALFIMVLKMA